MQLLFHFILAVYGQNEKEKKIDGYFQAINILAKGNAKLAIFREHQVRIRDLPDAIEPT